MPDGLRAALVAAYRGMGDDVAVAVRSSATAEDGTDTSFAGMNATFTNVRGEDELLQAVLDCWLSMFGERVVSYRCTQGIALEPALAVVVQQMVEADRSGVMFTADPSTGDLTRIVIEGAFGLGEVVVGGEVEPDTYVVDREGPRVVSVRVGRKAFEIVRGPDGHDLRVDLPEAEASRRVLADDEILELARTGLRVHAHYGQPQDIEWADVGGAVVHPAVPAHHDARPWTRIQAPRRRRTPPCSSPGSPPRRGWSPGPCASCRHRRTGPGSGTATCSWP